MTGRAQRREKDHRARWRMRGLLILAWLLLVSLGQFVMLWQVERFALKAYRVPSSAMEPTLHCARPAPGCEVDTADRILVSRLVPSWTPSRGDVVAFRAPEAARVKCGAGGTFVKRIVGLPGETVQVRPRRDAAHVYIDDTELDEPYVESPRQGSVSATTHDVPPGAYFMMGDNRSQSCDSRAFGSVPRANLVGPVVARYWPLDRLGSP